MSAGVNTDRVRRDLGEIPDLAAEVFLTWGHPNPTDRPERIGHRADPPIPLDMNAYDALRIDDAGLLAQLALCVRAVLEDHRDDCPDPGETSTWAGECSWLVSTIDVWTRDAWLAEYIPDTVTSVLAELRRAARVPAPLKLVCPRCAWPVHPQSGGAYYRCEAGHIIDHWAEVKRMGQIQELTTSDVTDMMGVTSRTLRRWKRDGWIKPCGMRSGQHLFTVADIQRVQEMDRRATTRKP